MALRSSKLAVSLAIVVLLTCVWIAMATSFTVDAGDFGAFYTGALIARSGHYESLHDAALQWRVQGPVLPTRPGPVFFVRPHVYAAFLSPLALFPIRTAFAIWATFLGLILGACGFWAYKRFGIDAVVFIALFPAAIFSIGFGQDVVLFLGLSVLSYWFFERGRPLLSGFALGLCFIKPHLLLLFPIVLCLQRRWRVLLGMTLAGTVEAAVSFWLGGLQGASRYLDFIRSRQGDLSPTPERMLNVQSIALNLGAEHTPLAVALIVVVIAAVALFGWRGEWWQGYTAAWTGTLLLAPHAYLYDSALLIPAALLVYFKCSRKAPRIIAAAFLTPIPSLLQLAEKPFTIAPALVVFSLLLALVASRLVDWNQCRKS